MTLLDIRPLARPPRRHRGAATAERGDLPLDGCTPVTPSGHPVRPRPDPGPDPVRARATAVVQVLLEVWGGHRPLSQLLGWASPRVQDEVGEHLEALAQVRTVGPRGVLPRARVASVHVSRPAAHAVEVTARVVQGERSRAVALRLEAELEDRQHVRWQCTALHWG